MNIGENIINSNYLDYDLIKINLEKMNEVLYKYVKIIKKIN
ncbi:MAG: hypothetical protein ACTHWZ_07170 [Peptoniphilaceae bacterium]